MAIAIWYYINTILQDYNDTYVQLDYHNTESDDFIPKYGKLHSLWKTSNLGNTCGNTFALSKNDTICILYLKNSMLAC